MKKSDIAKLADKELSKLLADIQAELDSREEARADAERKKQALINTMEEKGLSEADILAILGVAEAPKKQGAKVAPKYRNPANSAETWTGRGRQPRWVADAIAAGKSMQDLAI